MNTIERINNRWVYNEHSKTGLSSKKTGRDVGSVQHCANETSYWRVDLGSMAKKERLLAHRAIWMILNGDIPEGMTIDHINGNGLDNRISNLRLATRSQQSMNRKKCRGGEGLMKGVCKHKGRFRAQIRADGVKYHIGYYGTEEEAHRAYVEKAKQVHGLFMNTGY